MASQPPFANTASLSTSLADPLTIENGFAASPSQTHQYLRDQSELQAGLRPNLELRASRTSCLTPSCWSSNISALKAPIWAWWSSPIGLRRVLRRSRRSSSCRSAMPPASIIRPTERIRSSTRARCGSPAASRAGCRRRRSIRIRKSIDDASSFTGTGGTTVQFINNWGLERGLSSFDQRHRLSTRPIRCPRRSASME